jgi:lipase chaperone LimK
MGKLKHCIQALHVLARQGNDPNAQVSAERQINDFLREEDGTVSASLERISEAIDAEADKNVPGEDWSLMRAYVQWCRERLAIKH